jgi:hypothetical protein
MPAVCSRRPKSGNRISPDPRSGNHEIHEPHEKRRMIIANRRDGFGAGPGLLAASPFGIFRVFRGFSTSVCGAGMSMQILLCSLRGDGAGVRQRETWNSSVPARGHSILYPPSSSSGLRRGRLGQTPGKATCKRRASEGIETIKPYTSHMQATCKPVAREVPSYSLRILLVFSPKANEVWKGALGLACRFLWSPLRKGASISADNNLRRSFPSTTNTKR